MANLTTTYMGLILKNPIVPSASPLSKHVSTIRQMEDAGAAAITMYSLFEEQIDIEALAQHNFLEDTVFMSAEATAYFPKAADYSRGPDGYLDHIRQAKEAVDIPIIGSLNGVTTGGWTRYAKLIEDAGADALVLFNRFYQPDLDLEELDVVPSLVLSHSNEMRLPLRWIAILYGHVNCSLALTTGVHTPEDAVKAVMAGSSIANVASVLLHEGTGKITELVDGFAAWMEEHEYDSVDIMKGSLSQQSVPEPAAFERANYMKVLGSWK